VNIADRVRLARQRADQEAGRAQAVAQAGQRAEAAVAHLKEEIERYERVARLFTTIGEEAQTSAQHQIEEWVTRGLQVIFGEELSFHLVQSVRNNQAQVEFMLRSVYPVSCPACKGTGGSPDHTPCTDCRGNGTTEEQVDTPVLEARGGGMVVVVSFLLQLVFLLKTPGLRRLMVMDESFAHVSAGYEPRVAEFLREVCDRTGVQVILVTHSDAYTDAADKLYRLELGPDGATVLAEVT
jgi:vacuolar-type H+-ATPase subunit F/Vma7